MTGVQFPEGEEKCIFSITSRPDIELTQRPIQWVPEAVFTGIKRRELESGH
jgi:hypothetical protein